MTRRKAQSFVEFSWAMIMVFLLMLGTVKAFLWAGRDLVYRRQAHENTLNDNVNCSGGPSCALRQLRPIYYTTDDMRAAVPSNVFGN